MNPNNPSSDGKPKIGMGTLALGVMWLGIVVSMLAAIVVYTNSPGKAEAAPIQRPLASQIIPGSGHPLVVMFAHPHCPCTRASIGELGQLMTDCQGQLEAQVWFIKPTGTSIDWTNTDLWRMAARIPGVSVHCDDGEIEAQRFHALTSGETLLYDKTGKLLFQGGLTISRGHFGDNPELKSLEDLIAGKSAVLTNAPVFGCSLFDDECREGTNPSFSEIK
jgi:hypothetical protein